MQILSTHTQPAHRQPGAHTKNKGARPINNITTIITRGERKHA